jgi:L-ascorbate 6-phosphate lactonase
VPTVTSDWDDWLVRRIAGADPDGVAVWYLGCNGVVLKDGDGTTVFVDPYFGTGDPPTTVRMIPVPMAPADVECADAVFATHEHLDHVHGPSQGPLLASGATFYGPDDSVEAAVDGGVADEWDVPRDRLRSVSEGEAVGDGDSIDVGAFTVHVEAANDPDASHPVAYVFDHPAGTFVHGGDARPGTPFERIGRAYDIDLGALALGVTGVLPKDDDEPTTWYSDEAEVAEAARQLRLDRLLPSHWDMWKGMTADPTALHAHVRSHAFPRRLELVEIGDRVSV